MNCVSLLRLRFPLLLITALILAGCPGPALRIYSVKAEKRSTPDRMLGGILLRDQQAWFFKVTGPRQALADRADEVRSFLQSLTFAEGAEKPGWKLPAGWQVDEKPRQGRLATLLVPLSDGKNAELSITVLPYPGGDETGYLLANLNRWCGQLGAAELSEDDLPQLEVIAAGNLKIRLVTIDGEQKGGGMAAPFAS